MLKKNIGIALLITGFTTLAIAEELPKSATNKEATGKITKASPANVQSVAKSVPVAPTAKVNAVASKKENEAKLATNEISSHKANPVETKEVVQPEKNIEVEGKVISVIEEKGLDEVTISSTERIRSTFSVFAEAINKSDSKKLSSVARKELIVINSNQDFLNNKASIEEYFPVKAGKNLKRVDFSIDSGATVEMHSENLATVYGRGTESYTLGKVKHTIPMRWSAVVKKIEGEWKINSFHSGLAFADNSYIQSNTDFAWKIAAFTTAIGLLIGALFVSMVARLRK